MPLAWIGNDSNLLIVFYVQIMSNDFVMQFSLQAWFIKRPVIRHPYHDLKGRQQARKTLQRGQRAFTEYVRHNCPPYPVIRVKQPALAWFSADVTPLFIHFRANNDVTARLYTWVYRLRPEFFKCRKIVLRPMPIMRALARHPTPFMAISIIFWCVPGWEAV